MACAVTGREGPWWQALARASARRGGEPASTAPVRAHAWAHHFVARPRFVLDQSLRARAVAGAAVPLLLDRHFSRACWRSPSCCRAASLTSPLQLALHVTKASPGTGRPAFCVCCRVPTSMPMRCLAF